MNIYLQRHADAVPGAVWGKGDSTRPLSKEGKKQLEETIPHMRRAGFSLGCVLHSPYARAKETAEYMLRVSPQAEIHSVQELSSGAKNDDFKNTVKTFFEKGPLLLVAHMPDVGIFSARLGGMPKLLQDGLGTGEILAFEIDSPDFSWGKSKLLWRRRLEDWQNA